MAALAQIQWLQMILIEFVIKYVQNIHYMHMSKNVLDEAMKLVNLDQGVHISSIFFVGIYIKHFCL